MQLSLGIGKENIQSTNYMDQTNLQYMHISHPFFVWLSILGLQFWKCCVSPHSYSTLSHSCSSGRVGDRCILFFCRIRLPLLRILFRHDSELGWVNVPSLILWADPDLVPFQSLKLFTCLNGPNGLGYGQGTSLMERRQAVRMSESEIDVR